MQASLCSCKGHASDKLAQNVSSKSATLFAAVRMMQPTVVMPAAVALIQSAINAHQVYDSTIAVITSSSVKSEEYSRVLGINYLCG